MSNIDLNDAKFKAYVKERLKHLYQFAWDIALSIADNKDLKDEWFVKQLFLLVFDKLASPLIYMYQDWQKLSETEKGEEEEYEVVIIPVNRAIDSRPVKWFISNRNSPLISHCLKYGLKFKLNIDGPVLRDITLLIPKKLKQKNRHVNEIKRCARWVVKTAPGRLQDFV